MQASVPEDRFAFLKSRSWLPGGTVATFLCLALIVPAGASSAGRVIVQWAPGTPRAKRVAVRRAAGVTFESDLGNRRFQLVDVSVGQASSKAAGELEAEPAVALAEPDGVNETAAIPNDPLFNMQWSLLNTRAEVRGQPAVAGADIKAPGAWLRTVGDPSVVVADLDTGYRLEHPDLAPVTWTNPGEIPGNGVDDDHDGIVDDVHGADFIGANGEAPAVDGDPTDEDLLTGGHGIETAGTIGAAGNNGIGISGAAQNIRIMPLRTCSRFPLMGENRCLVSAEVAAVNYAAAKGVRIANFAVTGTEPSQALVNAMAAAKETLFITAAGNDRSDNDGPGEPPAGQHFPCDFKPDAEAVPAVPGAIDNVICVAATDQEDRLAPFSDWGRKSVDLGAPGTDALTTSAFPAWFEDGFNLGDFASTWMPKSKDGGFELTREAPLGSLGITDQNGPPPPNSVRESRSRAFTVPPNAGCAFNQVGRVEVAPGDAYTIQVNLDGAPLGAIESAPTFGPGLHRQSFQLPAAIEAGGQAQVRLRFKTGSQPFLSSGVLLDEVSVTCAEPLGQSSGYGFYEGTSTAAANVSGAAALLASIDPSAPVSLIRKVLLDEVDHNLELAEKTTSDGRLDLSKAVDFFDHTPPPAPRLTGADPPSRSDVNYPRIQGSAEEYSKVTLYPTGSCSGLPAGGGTAEELGSRGVEASVYDNTRTAFSATATDTAGNVSACSNSVEYVERTLFCRVPRLRGRPLAAAKAALRHADCKLGKVRRPKGRRGQGRRALEVASTKPGPGSKPADDVVDLRLRTKPARRHQD
jgi:subtilisin family serine protease